MRADPAQSTPTAKCIEEGETEREGGTGDAPDELEMGDEPQREHRSDPAAATAPAALELCQTACAQNTLRRDTSAK